MPGLPRKTKRGDEEVAQLKRGCLDIRFKAVDSTASIKEVKSALEIGFGRASVADSTISRDLA